MKPILIVAGEASGDLHGSEVMLALKCRLPNVRFVGIGGKLMTPLLDRKLADVSDLSVMGLVEVIKHLPKIIKLFDRVLDLAVEEDVGNALFIDYPGFNVRLAKALKKIMPSVYLHQFVCPQVWAWKAERIPIIGNTFDKLYCLFDFEPELFDKYPVEALWVGNPIVETTFAEVSRKEFFSLSGLNPNLPLVALLPGSRIDEIQRLMPPFVDLVNAWKSSSEKKRDIQWVIPVAPSVDKSIFYPYINHNISLVSNLSHASVSYADAALVCSGTATLETAILGTPFVAVYKLHPLTYFFAKRFVKVPYFSLANIISGHQVVAELIQGEVNFHRLSIELELLLDPIFSRTIRSNLKKIRTRLGDSGAAARVADHILNRVI